MGAITTTQQILQMHCIHILHICLYWVFSAILVSVSHFAFIECTRIVLCCCTEASIKLRAHTTRAFACVCVYNVHLCDLFHLFVMQIFCRKLILLLEIYKYIWIRIRKRSSCALFLLLSDISTLYLTRTSRDANQIIVTKYNLPNKNISKQEWTRADK